MADHRSRARRMLCALLDAPQLLSSEGIVRIGGLCAQADHLPTTVDALNLRRRKCFAHIAIVRRPSILVEILEIDRPVRSPDGLTRSFIERHHKLTVAAIEVHE